MLAALTHRIRTCSMHALINETLGADVILEIMCSDRKGDLCAVLLPYCLDYLETDFLFSACKIGSVMIYRYIMVLGCTICSIEQHLVIEPQKMNNFNGRYFIFN